MNTPMTSLSGIETCQAFERLCGPSRRFNALVSDLTALTRAFERLTAPTRQLNRVLDDTTALNRAADRMLTRLRKRAGDVR